MRFALALVLALHGLIHLVGPAKEFGWADVKLLRTPISHAAGALWLTAAVLLVVAAAGVALGARWWWYVALPGVLLSQALIVSAWSDAKFGTLANMIIAIPILVVALDSRASSFRSRFGAGLVPMVDKHGPGITHDETVTLMNDVLVMAPAAVLDLPFTFETTGERALRATFRNAGFTVSAALTFDAAGDLVGFVSADRAHDREAGAAEWSTPISSYRMVDGIRIGTRGDANWIERSGEWTYGRFEIVSITYNVVK
jgi:hypothetical protein